MFRRKLIESLVRSLDPEEARKAFNRLFPSRLEQIYFDEYLYTP